MNGVVVSKPLPALYTVYVLRSSVRHASLYIGSTPNPRRRLKQHNGVVKGGAARTSRRSLRPWEMVMLVSGFPSMVAALKFEWALTNPHLSLRIPDESRLTVTRQRKRCGRPRRPPPSLKSVVSNVHLLIGVPSFARWPLDLHFFAREVHAAWEKWLAASRKACRPGLRISTDFGGGASSADDDDGDSDGDGDDDGDSDGTGDEATGDEAAATGIDALAVDYKPMRDYVQKAHDVVAFEREGACLRCGEELESGAGLHAMCPNEGCTAMGHLDCWSRHCLSGDDGGGDGGGEGDGNVLPDLCTCPSCGGEVRWVDMVKELSLRIRGGKEVERLLRKKKKRVGRPKKTA